MNAHTSLWTLLLHPQGTDLLPFAKSNTWSAQSQSLLEWTRLNECNDRIRSPGFLWTILHQTSVPSGATWADLIAEHTPEDLPNALKGRSGTEGPGIASWNVRWLIGPHSVQNILKRQRIRRWLGAEKIILLQETHWETSGLAVWENLFPAATIIASEAANGAGGVAILVPPSVEVSHKRIRNRPWVRCDG